MTKNYGIFTFEKFHGKQSIGSSKIRVHWPLKYWPEAEVFTFGQKYDAVIFQKAYPFVYAEHLKNTIKILDMCDPEWLDGVDVVRMFEAVDAITCSSETLAKHIKGLTDKPVVWIKDRFDLNYFPESKKKVHKDKASRIVWFGYAHNAHTIRPALKHLSRLKLKLTVIADSQEKLNQMYLTENLSKMTFVRWSDSTVQRNLLKNDIVVLPGSPVPRDRYKSENKTVWSYLLGLPVAKNVDDLERLIDPAERVKDVDKNYLDMRKEYDVRKSVTEYKELIESLKT